MPKEGEERESKNHEQEDFSTMADRRGRLSAPDHSDGAGKKSFHRETRKLVETYVGAELLPED